MSHWLDFESIKPAANLESVLRYYGVNLRRSAKDQYRDAVPFTADRGARPSMRIWLVMSFTAMLAVRAELFWTSSRQWSGALCTRLRKEERFLCRCLSRYETFDCSHPYLAERGIGKEKALTFCVGFWAGPGLMHGRLVIPIHSADRELIA
jgi:hypothetical protein